LKKWTSSLASKKFSSYTIGFLCGDMWKTLTMQRKSMIYITCERIYIAVVIITPDMLRHTWDEIEMIHDVM
jgi:hypothetical protein